MDQFVVRGGRPLRGRVRVGGAKNAALPIMAAALVAEGPLRLRNVPDLVDVRTQSQVLGRLGVAIERPAAGELRLEANAGDGCVAPYDLVRRMRASVCVLGPLLARRGRAVVSLPGGCNIGHRPIDLHLKGLAALGADIRIENGYVVAEAHGLRGATIDLSGPHGSTVTGTCNVMTAATLARGTTVIQSAAREPEVVDLALCLNAMGARIAGAGASTLRIEGVEGLSGVDYAILPDRIEAATLMCAAVITGGSVEIEALCPEHLSAVCEKLASLGAAIDLAGDAIRVTAPARPRPGDCIAAPYPGLPTDLQAQLTAVLTRADGLSVVTDTVFPDRFMHVSELIRLGANIRQEGSSAIIRGPADLSGAPVMASDLRASAALVLAALAARGESIIRRIYHLDRGYERLEEKLRRLGADVERVAESEAAEGVARDSPSPRGVIPAPHIDLADVETSRLNTAKRRETAAADEAVRSDRLTNSP